MDDSRKTKVEVYDINPSNNKLIILGETKEIGKTPSPELKKKINIKYDSSR